MVDAVIAWGYRTVVDCTSSNRVLSVLTGRNYLAEEIDS